MVPESREAFGACSLLPPSDTSAVQSGSKLHALQTLARGSVHLYGGQNKASAHFGAAS
jgi:hypothetical protein